MINLEKVLEQNKNNHTIFDDALDSYNCTRWAIVPKTISQEMIHFKKKNLFVHWLTADVHWIDHSND